jgi:hypothetical protein
VSEPIVETGPGTHFDVKTQVELAETSTLSTASGALSFWMRPDWDDGDAEDTTFLQLGDSGIFVTKVGDTLRVEVTDADGVEQSLSFPIDTWKRGHWRYIATSWEDGTYVMYVDGEQVAELPVASPPDFQPGTRVYVGTNAPAGALMSPAVVSQVTVLNRSVYPGEVSAAFRSGIMSDK